jgi:UDP-N-acetylmuramate: L-alanyl-gamma-D-glutamyl-meso-diaminopimelate ligase
MKVHFIAIGGSAMHNLAIALHKMNYTVTGSDDEIFEPSRGRLEGYGLLPDQIGWNPDLIHSDLDAVILGMHAREDNPELRKALDLGIKIYSYPEFLFEQSKNKKRIVIGGSHGKTSITSMIIHVFQHNNVSCDYMVGAKLDGFDVMVKFSDEAEYMIIEGDEYLTSPIDRVPKFHHYKPDIAVISGIAWDHINVFPTFENYVDQFRIFLETIQDNGTVISYKKDIELNRLVKNIDSDKINCIEYQNVDYKIVDGISMILFEGREYPINIFGKHNMENLQAAWEVCKVAGFTDMQFLDAIQSFKGASNRLELVDSNDYCKVFKDFAHAPSKLKATVNAVKELDPERKLVACMELHTFSSLSLSFLKQYEGSMDNADLAFVYFNPHTIEHKRLPELNLDDVKSGFANKSLKVYTDSSELFTMLKNLNWDNSNLLLMSSGNFDGINFVKLANEITHK